MIKKKYFALAENPYQPGKYMITIDFDLLPEMRTNGSYFVLFARLMNLSFAQWIRFCRDCFDGEVVGKKSLYPSVYFKKNTKTVALVRLLNSRMNYVIWEREHPDWREHEEYLTQKKEYMEKWKDVYNS